MLGELCVYVYLSFELNGRSFAAFLSPFCPLDQGGAIRPHVERPFVRPLFLGRGVPMRGSRISILAVSALLLVGTEVYGLTGFPFDFKHRREYPGESACDRARPASSWFLSVFSSLPLFPSSYRNVFRARRHVPPADSLIRDVNTAVVSAETFVSNLTTRRATYPRTSTYLPEYRRSLAVPEDRENSNLGRKSPG